jgi:hypothetical protein
MSPLEALPAAEAAAPLTQMQRVTCVFTAPSRTFADIKRGNRSWWLPFLLFVLIGTGLWATVTVKVGWRQVTENGLRMAPKQAEQLESLPPDQREMRMKVGAIFQEGLWALAPVWLLIINLIAAGILLGTINFGFGGKATYGQVLAVSWYGALPMLIKLLLGIIGLFAGVAPEAFLPGNPAGTNAGYYLDPNSMSMALWTVLVFLDVTGIWSLILSGKGLATVAGTKPSSGYIAVFGWWFVALLLQVGLAVAFS